MKINKLLLNIIKKIMKNKLILLLFFSILSGNNIVGAIQTEKAIIIKLKSDSLSFSFLSEIIPDYKFQKLIQPRLLEMPSRKALDKLQSYTNPANSLSRIYKITYKSNYPINKLLKYLNSLPEIEYAEIFPERQICFIPNDTLFNKQYYLNKIYAPEGWDTLKPKKEVIIGIIDMGVDYRHDDLKDNIYENSGEIGLDSLNLDKRNNGIDDDGNGYIDDWHGWDFASDSLGEDNDPIQGHAHGTHVAGITGAIINNITGIAGVAKNVKLLAVKVGFDSPFSNSVIEGFNGIIYASKMGADIINCSWGSSSYSQAEKEVIDYANSLGSTVIAAAGNNNYDGAFYPAAYSNVVSVAASDSNDVKASFSNYHYTVDVTAPGLEIFSTVPWNGYDIMSGTSMASPVAAGVAAMIKMEHPDYTPTQVAEHLIATCDNIDSLNPGYVGKLGNGRVNAFKAISIQNPKNLRIKEYFISSSEYHNVFFPGDTCQLGISIENVLSDIEDLNITAKAISPFNINIENNHISVGAFQSGNTLELKKLFTFILPDHLDYNQKIELELSFYDGTTLIRRGSFSFYSNPTYLTIGTSTLGATFNSHGNIAYNDYPKNEQGDGFYYKNSDNLLYEGALMVASGRQRLSNVARADNDNEQDNDFFMNKAIEEYLIWINWDGIDSSGFLSYIEGETEFQDSLKNDQAGIAVKQRIVMAHQGILNAMMINYDIINKRDIIQDSLYVGLYFDWDIGLSGMGNYTSWNDQNQLAIVRNVQNDTLPIIGVKMASNEQVNFWAIDNDGTSDINPGVWDGFTKQEKIKMLESGMGRMVSKITDVSTVIGAGPIFLNKNDTVRIKFIIYADSTIENIIDADNKLKENDYVFDFNPLDDNFTPKFDSSVVIRNIFPNPIKRNSILTAHIILKNTSNTKIDLYDLLGRKVARLFEGRLGKGEKLIHLRIGNLAIGSYRLIIETADGKKEANIIIME